MYTLDAWLNLSTAEIAEIVAAQATTAAVYLNGTRRWFLSRSQNWEEYTSMTAVAHRELNQLLYEHGLRTLIQPLLGYDLLERGKDYIEVVVDQGLSELFKPDYRAWFERLKVSITFYGNWREALQERGFSAVVRSLENLVAETARYKQHKLLFGIFADEGLNRITTLARQATDGQALLSAYYGQSVSAVNFIIGSGQPAIWDLPMLDINKASLYFLQAPTFCLDQQTLRRILYDHLFIRVNDDEVPTQVSTQRWQPYQILGMGEKTEMGWTAL
jgi:hypothetical protein